MALTYAQLDALTTNAAFLARVRSAVASHAQYWKGNNQASISTQQWVAIVFWAGGQCAQIAADMARELVEDSKFTGSSVGDGSDVTDANLQAAVDAICEKYVG
jgi:hypothetical protein